MDGRARLRSTLRQLVYQDFVPSQNSVEDEESETLLIELPGFIKEQIEIQVDEHGKMRISGQRPLGDNRWSRFHREYQVPENCNIDEIRAQLEDGLLSITLPKLVTKSGQHEESSTTTAAAQVIPEPKPASGSHADVMRRRTGEADSDSSRMQRGREKINGEAAAAGEDKEEKAQSMSVAGGCWKEKKGGRGISLFGLQYWRPWRIIWLVIAVALAVGLLGFYI